MKTSKAEMIAVDRIIFKKPSVEALPKHREAPKIAEISAWLSLDGIANIHAPMPKTITVTRHAHTPSDLYSPNDAIENTYSATLNPDKVDNATPVKLHNPPIRHACFFEKTPELIIPETEFGASVNPFTKTTPRIRKNIKISEGVSVISIKKEKSISLSPSYA
jgi:hypothetical protein